jgi:hypothetical protein
LKGACADLDFGTSEDKLMRYVPADIIWIVACKRDDGDFALERRKTGKTGSEHKPFGDTTLEDRMHQVSYGYR